MLYNEKKKFMMILLNSIKCWLSQKNGASAIEYALLAAGIGLAIVAAVFLTGGSLSGLFETMSTAVSDANGKITTS